MSEIHPHDALLRALNEEQFGSQKAYGMWGGCDWVFIDADPDAIVIQVVSRERHEVFAKNIAEAVASRYQSQFRTRLIRTWSRTSGSAEEPLLKEFEFTYVEDPSAEPQGSAALWERCAAIGWERGTKAKARPEAGQVHRVVNVVSAAPATPKPHGEMTEAEIRTWAGAWAKQIVAQLGEQGGAR